MNLNQKKIVLATGRIRLASGLGVHPSKLVGRGQPVHDLHIHLGEHHEVDKFNVRMGLPVKHKPLDVGTILRFAEEDNVQHLGLVRHHSLVPFDQNTVEEARKRGLLIEFGGEFNVTFKGEHIHMVTLVPAEKHSAFNEWLHQFETLNKEMAFETLQYLNKKHGFDISHINPKAVMTTGYVSKRLLAELIMTNKRNMLVLKRMRVKDYAGFKHEFLRRGKVPFSNYAIKGTELIQETRKLGGETILAHPFSKKRGTSAKKIVEFAELGGHTIEIGAPSHGEQKTAELIDIVNKEIRKRKIPIMASATGDMHSDLRWPTKQLSDFLIRKMIACIDAVPRKRK
jgi:hypothetical protein